MREERLNIKPDLWFYKQMECEIGIYLDNSATTYPKPFCVYDAVDYGNRYLGVNAGRGGYRLAQMAEDEIEKTRMKLLKSIQAIDEAEVVFTPSATIALNEIIGGLTLSERDVVYVSPFAHNAVVRTLWQLKKKTGFEWREIPVEQESLEVDINKLQYMFGEKKPSYVFLSHVSNVTGYILPVEKIYKITKEMTQGEGKVILDAAQSFGLLGIDYRNTPYDAIVFAGHKTLYGPFGVGGFIRKIDFKPQVFLGGGTGTDSLSLEMPLEMEKRWEPGSPNFPAILGLQAGMAYLEEIGKENLYLHEKELTEQLIAGLEKIYGVQLFVPRNPDKRIGIVSFALDGYLSDEVGQILDEEYHISVRTGYHCAPLIHKHLQSKAYGGTVRVSIGWFNTKEEIEKFIGSIREIVEG